MSDSQSASDHFQRLERLAGVLAGRGIAVYEHDYRMLAFGSFRIEVGTRQRRWGFAWDGRDGVLDVCGPYAPEAGRTAPPVAGRAEHLGLGDLAAPFRFLEGFDFVA